MLGEQGRGLAQESDVEDDVDFIIGTFSKSLGAIGGFCVSKLPELEVIRYAMRPYIFTASPSPSMIASTRVALQILRNRHELREQLWRNSHRLYEGLQELGYTLGPEPSPVVATKFRSKMQALEVWSALMERGVYVNLVLPPAAPSGDSLLRCSVSAAHTLEQIDAILEAFASVKGAELTAEAG